MCPSLACTPSTGRHASPPIKIHPVLLTQSTPLLISASHSSSKSPPFASSFRVVSCARRSWCMCGASHLRFAWCSTPPTANAYTTRSCEARLPARFGHIVLSCGVQYQGRGLKGMLDRTISLHSVRDNMREVLVPCCLSIIPGTIIARHCDIINPRRRLC